MSYVFMSADIGSISATQRRTTAHYGVRIIL